jgi:hypothetical protein
MYRVIKPAESDSAAQVSAFGYAKSNGNNNTTLGIFKKIENHDADAASMISSPTSSSAGPTGLREKYKSYIRQLPSKQHVEKLLVTYFKESNYQYYPLDEGIFRDHLKNWYSLSFSTLNKGPSELSGDLQFFPALLFQTLALALQFQPPDYDPSLDSLKYAAGMTFDDLASDYSESGCQILCLLGKRQTTLITVQAGFLRVQYLKNCGMVPESWHYLSQTIRDAQEIGLHKDTIEHRSRRPDEKPEDVLENLWLQQLRRRLWLILTLWDIHMGIVLGRPTSVDSRDGRPVFPIDAPIPKNRREEAPMPRTDSDPPTPLTMLLWTAEIGAPLWDIFNLEKEDPHQNNFARVEKMHKLIDQISLHCPPFFRAQNPDTTFDSLEECHWLPRARAYFQGSSAFTIMALHRPYIFTNSSSRTAALKAALNVLRSQRTMFNLLNAKHYKMFSLVLNTFDAIVLVAAIYILHPYENPDDLDHTLQHFEWGMERFQTMSGRNSMAKAALGVLKAIYVRLKKALNQPIKNTPKPLPPSNSAVTTPAAPSPESYSIPTPNPQLPTPSANASISRISPASNITNQSNTSSSNTPYTLPTISNMTDSTPATSAWEAFSGSMSIPPNFDFSSMAPLQPMHDLVFNDLGGTIGGGMDFSAGNTFEIPTVDSQWQFEGDFGNDSFWGFMNNYNP